MPAAHTDSGAAAFARAFGTSAAACAIVPGRVNLIGDHIDYCGLTVMPMAVQRGVRLHFRARPDGRVRVDSTATGFSRSEFVIGEGLEARLPDDWGRYAAAAIGELFEVGESRGFDGLVDSDLPIAAGLSSSSALVVASALAYLDANERQAPPLELARRLAAAERFVGTRGGGMDQAILLGARAGHAACIGFDPLRLDPVEIPPAWRFLVAHSLVRAEKSGASRAAYNERAITSRAALAAAAARLGMAGASYSALLRDRAPAELIEAARRLPDDQARCFRHVVTEGLRVMEARSALESGEAARFGRLMTASHRSLRDDLGVSTAQLDTLARIALDAGARGARLTGAGFGGCLVALADGPAGERAVAAALAEAYYGPAGLNGPALAEVLFAATAAAGARVIRLD